MMEFRTKVDIPSPDFTLKPFDKLLFVGSCFADNLSHRFAEEKFRVTCNPFGVMYNPVSILHTVEKCEIAPDVAFFTLGTNRVYRLISTSEIVDNCCKLPQKLFLEEELSVQECVDALQKAIDLLSNRNPKIRIVITVSPIRYAKYGFHGSQIAKSVLLLAVESLVKTIPHCVYFPAYEIINDELRDYRFYSPDMLHPSSQAVEYIWQRFSEAYLSEEAKHFLAQWKPIKDALGHHPRDRQSQEYLSFMEKTRHKILNIKALYPEFEL